MVSPMKALDPEILLGPEGPFTEALPGFHAREGQQRMADLVRRTLDEDGTLVVEAGTGIGKTFAYLVPVLNCGGKVIVSTGTRALQDQLFHKDLPIVARALGAGLRTALLKGRANYLCPHRLSLTGAEGRFPSRAAAADLGRIQRWSQATKAGDIAELADIPADSALWPQVTSTADNCLGAECPELSRCFLAAARRKAQEADVVVINHHLLLADLALKEEGFGELLPEANAFILDEAHQLPETAATFFGSTVGSRQLLELARDAVAEQLREAPDMPALRDAASTLEKAVADLRLALGEDAQRSAWVRVERRPDVASCMEALAEALAGLSAALEVAAERGKGLEQCAKRAGDLASRLSGFAEPVEGEVRWYETFRRGFALHATPLDVSDIFGAHRSARRGAWIFTSATLSVDGRFEHFSGRMGLAGAVQVSIESPYDYARNALLYLPKGMPDPNDPGHTGAVVEAALRAIEANPGGTFLLFTSRRALREAAERLEGRTGRPVFVQDSAPHGELLQRFREAGNGVLLGVQSFWEGVDVRGSALSCVVIDKLPFASPGDPVLEARTRAIREAGGNPFMEYQVPQAVISLKQGVGRLIRDEDDRGVLVLCDPRLTTKAYGRSFLNSLPPMPLTREPDDVDAFFAAS